MQNDSLDKWLNYHIKENTLSLEDSVVLDIGAYQGDFILPLLSQKPDRVLLFEANPENYEFLKSKFKDLRKTEIIPFAVSDKEGSVKFYCDQDKSTGSVLPYQFRPNNAPEVKEYNVKTIRLDNYLREHGISKHISLIKIDTQGNDLNVLIGAEETIKSHRPWMLVELNFVSFYKNQDSYNEICSWLRKQNYALAGIFNLHYSTDGWMAYADGVFVPQERTESFKMPLIMNPITSTLADEITMLKKTCQDRLDLINELNEISKERLSLINKLQNLCHDRGTIKSCIKKIFGSLRI